MYFLLFVENWATFGVLKAYAEGELGSINFERRKKVIGGRNKWSKISSNCPLKKLKSNNMGPKRILQLVGRLECVGHSFAYVAHL
jgi:hypothetical protein